MFEGAGGNVDSADGSHIPLGEGERARGRVRRSPRAESTGTCTRVHRGWPHPLVSSAGDESLFREGVLIEGG